MSEILSEKTSGKLAKVNKISNVDFLCLSQSTLTTTSSGDENVPVDLDTTNLDLQLLSNSQTEQVLQDLLPDNDGFDDIVKYIDKYVPMAMQNSNPRQSCPMPVLNNCNNVTVNIHYNVFPQKKL